MKETIKSSVKTAMKAGDKVRVETLRSVLSEIQYEEMNKKVDSLSDEAIVALLQREIKKRKEELDFAEKAQRNDTVERLHQELAIVESFLPSMMSEDELHTAVVSIKETSPGIALGGVMKALKDSYAGKYDAKLASDVAKKVLG